MAQSPSEYCHSKLRAGDEIQDLGREQMGEGVSWFLRWHLG